MENYPLYFCAHFIEAISLWQYCATLFHSKYSTTIKFAVLAVLYGISSITAVLQILSLNIFLSLLVHFVFIYFMFILNFFAALFHATLITSLMGLSELIMANIVPNGAFDFFDSSYFEQTFIVQMLPSKLLYFFLLYIISHIWTRNKELRQTNSKEIFLLITIPLLSIWIILSLMTICIEVILPTFLNYMVLISTLLLLIINLITWSIYTYTQRKNREFTNLQLQLQKEQDTAEYNKMLLKHNESQKILIHDIKNHLNSISLLNEQGQTEKISAYIHRLLNSSDLQTAARMCDHELLNSILGRYSQQCKDLNINFHADVRTGVVDFMDENHLTALFCNLLDNSVEAARHYPDGFIDLMVSKRSEGAMTLITLVNSCRVDPFDKDGKLVSKKGDPLHHGFGVRSIERITKCYGGEMKQYYNAEDYTFHTIILLMRPKK